MFTFRLLTRADFSLLAQWLATPHVLRWWHHDTAPGAIEADFGPSIDGVDPAEIFVALADECAMGLVQRYRYADNPEYVAEVSAIVPVPSEALSIDYFVGEPQFLGRGIGAAMIAAFVDATWRACPRADSIIVPVHVSNRASWRALERAGFHRTGEGLLEPDNPVDDRAHYVYRTDRPATWWRSARLVAR